MTIDTKAFRKDPKCKICQLEADEREIFFELHKQMIGGVSVGSLHTWLGRRMVEHNSANPEHPLSFVTPVTIANHFKKHVPATVREVGNYRHEMDRISKTELFPPEVAAKLKKLSDGAEAENLEDLGRYVKIARTVQERFARYDEKIGEDVLTAESIPSFKMLAELAAKLCEGAIKIRGQDKLVTAALTSALDTFSIGALQQLLGALDRIILDFRSEFRDPARADQMAMRLREAIARAMTENAKSALDSVRDQIKVG